MNSPFHVFKRTNCFHTICCVSRSAPRMKHTPFPALLVHWLCWTTVELGSTMVPSMVARPGDNVTLQCVHINRVEAHMAWFKQMDVYMSFTNVTFLEIKVSEDAINHGTKLCTDKDGSMSMFPLVLILGGVTAVFLLVILLLLFHISRGRDARNTGSISQQQDEQVQDSGELIYAPLKFTSKRKKGQRTRKMDLETQVVYAATR
ncbi:uncharacterized protein LOC124487157 isoform X2 [Hypomesus transpacificus]|uniref:uncharacterized protein LOC124487157 isoform X2 n=1 Tax=Hypomesus transpacificus TaxID=137520 RepID=UPI001F072CBB|nr:uncharacterized protein LOC124487157 isoform X2 [Hypomesus transpacificus]